MVFGQKINQRLRERWNIQMVMNMKVNGIKDKDMEREYKHENVELFVKEYGNMIN